MYCLYNRGGSILFHLTPLLQNFPFGSVLAWTCDRDEEDSPVLAKEDTSVLRPGEPS